MAGLPILIYFGICYIVPLVFPTPKIKQTRPRPVQYSYYQIIDETTGKTLTYVSSISVNVGDEYVTGENQRYVVVRVKGNKAFARYDGTVKYSSNKRIIDK